MTCEAMTAMGAQLPNVVIYNSKEEAESDDDAEMDSDDEEFARVELQIKEEPMSEDSFASSIVLISSVLVFVTLIYAKF